MEWNKQTQKKVIVGSIILGVAVTGFMVYRKLGARGKILRKLGGRKGNLSNDKKGNLQGKNTEIKFDPSQSANELKVAMKGWGTNESKIWNALDPLTKEQRLQVKSYFDTYLGNGNSLFEWFEGDLSGDDLIKAKAYFN